MSDSPSAVMPEEGNVRLDEASKKPFTSESKADTYLQRAGLDRDVWGVCRYNGGYAVAKHRWISARQAAEQDAAEERTRQAAATPESYHWVVLAGAGGPNDYVEVPVNVNGQFPGMLWLKRGVKIPLPMSIINVLKDAKHGNYRPSRDPAVPYVKDGDIVLFPHTIVSDAAKADWEQYREQGRVEREKVIASHQAQGKG